MAALVGVSPSLSAPLVHKVNTVSGSSIAADKPSTINFQPIVRNGRSHGYHLLAKSKISVDTDVLRKDSISIEANVSVKADVLAKESNYSSSVESVDDPNDYGVVSIHHVGILCENLERSLDFYQNVLGLKVNEARPDEKLPYRGAWLWVGSEMIHLMELPNPDPLTGRPEHGGRDRHTCIEIRDVYKLKAILDKAGIPYTLSRSGRPAIFTRDPDANALEFAEFDV